jgi:hypothetical protein
VPGQPESKIWHHTIFVTVAPASAMAQEASSNSFSFSLVTRRCNRPNDTSGASKILKKLSMIDFESHYTTDAA